MIDRTIQQTSVPALGFGTYQLRGTACREAVADALTLGYRHIDTAQAYRNEAEVGAALATSDVPRDDLFVTTKVWVDHLEPDTARRTTTQSLRDLQLDYVDLLLIHWPNEDAAPLEATLDALDALKDEGKTRHIGVSNFTPTLLQRAIDHTTLFCHQVEYHPFLSQDALLAQARSHDLLLTAYTPLARGEVLASGRLQAIGERHGKTPAQVTLRWLVQQEQVAAIPKASSAQHRKENIDIFDFSLSDEEMRAIHTLAAGQRLVDPAFAPNWER
ncbi:MAG: aldo/keto reductase [Bacteroidetes bacterium]|jgi:2,5-diketo-D-gluconate reductase B|nr:aldo/keto reductase [Bacteroidota bacterium]